MKNKMLKIIITVFTAAFIQGLASKAYSQVPGKGGSLSAGFGLMYLASSTDQGGKGSEGSTLLTETEIMNKGTWYNFGVLLQYDSQGESQKDFELAYKNELDLSPFFFEFSYSFIVQRTFTDRSIASQDGYGYRFGAGVRVPLSFASMFMQFSYKQRTQVITEQDGAPLDQKIKQTDTYPIFGIGMNL